MIEIFLEAPIELKLMILGGIAALIVVLINGIGERMILSLIIVLTKMRNGGKMVNSNRSIVNAFHGGFCYR